MDYYGKFLPDLSTVLAPLYQLLQKNTKWFWALRQTKVFESVKKLFTSVKVLVHYDPTKELVLACDASPYGVGAVLLHPDRDGKDRPIAYASRSLATAKRNYAQLEKEGLAIVFGVKRVPSILIWSTVHDHFQPQTPTAHFKETSSIPPLASARNPMLGTATRRL